MNLRSPLVLAAVLAAPWCVLPQRLVLPDHLPSAHPRVAARAGNSQPEIRALIASDPVARDIIERAEAELAPYLERVRTDPEWMASRLQMYWKSHATEIYNRGDSFDHAGGPAAPVATVRFPGSRNSTTVYRAPKLEDIPPFEDETKGVLVVNGSLSGHPLEWASPSKTGWVIDVINRDILHYAQNAAQLAWLTGNEEYARFAFTIFDTYMRGIDARNEPIDLNHGFSQNIYGMSSFEVIQEGVLQTLATTYDFLYDFNRRSHPDALPVYASAFRKWIAVTIHNGVPFNNWDLFKARLVVSVALVLEDNSAYSNHQGAQYFLDQILNEDATRQWSLRKLATRGFDPVTGIWFESPGYSMDVTNNFITLLNTLDQAIGTDLLKDIPIVGKAVYSMAQYAFPNGLTVAWGDSHYGPISTSAACQMVLNAQRHHRPEQEVLFTSMVYQLNLLNGKADTSEGSLCRGDRSGLDALFDRTALKLDPTVPPLKPSDLLTATFSAPSVSYFVQRNGLDPKTALMISEAGSLGNHQHANGISMELYGFGLPLAPDAGIGSSYFNSDYAEYYSQFPAHNTVAVDGISAYPTMKSHHGFTVNDAFPPSGDKHGIDSPITFSDVSFVEPETQADQRRVMSIIRTSPTTGYYLDIFRSRRRDHQDLKHDYFFHGLGQTLDIADENGKPLLQTPTKELTFANEELVAYDYLYDKHAVASSTAYRASYTLKLPNQPERELHLWLAGEAHRQLFSVLAPPQRSLGDVVPETLNSLPMRTLVLRQSGEAWDHPFISIVEPADSSHPASVERVQDKTPAEAPKGVVVLRVDSRGGIQQWIFNSDEQSLTITTSDHTFQGDYGVLSTAEKEISLFLGSGQLLGDASVTISLQKTGSAFVEHRDGGWTGSLTEPGLLTIAEPLVPSGELSWNGKQYRGKRIGGTFTFSLPATD